MQIVVEELTPPMVIQWERGMTDDEFYRFSMDNPDLRIERTIQGDLVIMPPTGSETGFRNSKINARLTIWAEKDGSGQVFDSSSGYFLPDGAALSPDASWVSNSRLQKLTKEQKRGLFQLCPDFVIELMSPSDRLSKLEPKMQEWIENGAQLGWLLDPDHRTVYIYSPGSEPERVSNPDRLVGEGPVAGFVLELADIWAGL